MMQGWKSRQNIRFRLQATPFHRFSEHASFNERLCFGHPEREETLTEHAGEDEADSQTFCSQIEKRDGRQSIQRRQTQKRDVKGLLRVDKFRTYGPEDQKSEYHKRPHIEAVYSFLKTQYSLVINKVRGLRNVASYALYSLLCMVLNREAAENHGRPDRAVSPTYFNT